jgi:integrase
VLQRCFDPKIQACSQVFGRPFCTAKLSCGFGTGNLKQIDFLQLAAQLQSSGQAAAVIPPTLNRLSITARKETTHSIRDGEVVLYLRPDSAVWQVRYKLFDRKWHCVSTRQRRLDWAKRVAGEMYDRARFREEEGLPQKTKRFDAIARECIKVLEMEIERGIRRETNKDYIRTINKYLVPFFGKLMLSNITVEKVRAYEQWRNEQMGRVPISSTLATHASAYSRVLDFAIEQGWLSDKVAIPRLNRKGKKGSARPGFSKEELAKLMAFLPEWSRGGERKNHREMRLLLRDYVEVLLGTGCRSGRESMAMQWRHLEWHVDSKTGQRYLRIWVSGKTGGRWLIAKHWAVDVFTRLAVRQGVGENLDQAIEAKSEAWVFATSNGVRPNSLHTSFELLLADADMRVDPTTGKNRSLYSLRHSYATMSLMDGQMDMHTLAKQMGTSIGMLEQHYSKMTATMAADRLA